MVMHEQSRRLSQPLRWTRGGRIAVLAAVAVLIGGTVASVLASSSDKPLPRGCIEVTFASTLGAATDRRCGAHAREACAAPAQSPALAAHGALRAACRKAGLPYARGASPRAPSGG
jgi:hypothetical protein